MRGRFLWILGAIIAMELLVFARWARANVAPGLDAAVAAALEGVLDPWRVSGDASDLVIPPGGRGFVAALRTGPQLHRHDAAGNRTTILDEIWLGHRSFRYPVAEYDGPPSRDVAPERVRRLPVPHAFLLVRRGRGPAEGMVVKPGRAVVDGRHGVTLAPGEVAWVTVGPEGLSVDDRDAP
ncbi:MAG: hypothetical protein L6Q95_20025 [Planctomycetes bacterium]|nr:hypothetical protein [Planctomycetota bacterium]